MSTAFKARTTLAEEIRELIRAEIDLRDARRAADAYDLAQATETAERAFRMLDATIDDLTSAATTSLGWGLR